MSDRKAVNALTWKLSSEVPAVVTRRYPWGVANSPSPHTTQAIAENLFPPAWAWAIAQVPI